MSTVVAPQPITESPADDEDNVIHSVCDLDDRWALCGRNVESDPWVWEVDDPSPECDTCADFDEADFCAHCAMKAGTA